MLRLYNGRRPAHPTGAWRASLGWRLSGPFRAAPAPAPTVPARLGCGDRSRTFPDRCRWLYGWNYCQYSRRAKRCQAHPRERGPTNWPANTFAPGWPPAAKSAAADSD